MRKTAISAVLMVVVVALMATPPTADGSSPIIRCLGDLTVGRTVDKTVNFVRGVEVYVGRLVLPVDVVAGSQLGLTFSTFHPETTIDTEISVYGPNAIGLIAMNDDGPDGSWGDPGLTSMLNFGDAELGTGGYNGNTIQGTFPGNPTGLNAGIYAFILTSYSTVWDEIDARDSTIAGTGNGTARVTISLYDVP